MPTIVPQRARIRATVLAVGSAGAPGGPVVRTHLGTGWLPPAAWTWRRGGRQCIRVAFALPSSPCCSPTLDDPPVQEGRVRDWAGVYFKRRPTKLVKARIKRSHMRWVLSPCIGMQSGTSSAYHPSGRRALTNGEQCPGVIAGRF